ncbi:MAG: class IIb bacteriocin, lactobin A/cerein 7B family [Pseudorhodobacter sp.]
MFAEMTDLNLDADLNENAMVELNAADVDDVSGGIAPLALLTGGAIAFAGGAAIGFAVSYWANRD